MQDQTQLDPDAVNLAKAIRQTESGGNFQAKGKSGEYGAYQFTEPTWNNYAKEAGVNKSLSEATPEEQNQVAYTRIKKWKDSGHNIGEIASMWNAGQGKPNAYIEGNKGINEHGVSYDTATYARNVATQYQQMKQQGSSQSPTYNPKPFSQPTGGGSPFTINTSGATDTTKAPDSSLGGQLGGRVNDASTAISDTISGKINPVSGVLQTAGAIAGGIGDVVNKGLELIPGVKAIEGVIGSGISSLAQTDTGKSIISSLQKFGQDHPELSKDIEAGFNIITAIPILKGLGVVKNLALDGASLALKNVAEKAATKDLTATVSRTVGGRKALERGGADEIKTLIDERAIPDIEGGKYTTKEASSKLSEQISHIEDNELQPALDKANTSRIADRIPLEDYKKQAVSDAIEQLKDPAPIEKYFERLKAKYGDYPSLKQMNEAKRIVSRNISEAGFNSPTYSTDKVVRSALQKSVEEGAKALGLPDVNAINAKMARLIKAQDMLDHIEGKPVKTGLVGGLIKDTATVGGEMLGNATGIPLAGAYIGREGGGFVGKKLAGVSKGILDRTSKEVGKKPLKGTGKRVVKGAIGALAQKANQK
jgi:hypothetical protein